MVSENDFNLFSWSDTIPLCDDLWLGMQARNIAIVDMTILRPMEGEALGEFMRTERTPTMILVSLSALSQMWGFSLYEFLRTWRQRARDLLAVADGYQAAGPDHRRNTRRLVLRVLRHKLAPECFREDRLIPRPSLDAPRLRREDRDCRKRESIHGKRTYVQSWREHANRHLG
jgi:hypothetical protein